MNLRRLRFATFNLLNLNEPGLPIYSDRDGWSAEAYRKKIAWTARQLRLSGADVFGFQELWHGASLEAAFAAASLADQYTLLVPPGHSGGRIVCAAAVRVGLLAGGAAGGAEWIEEFPAGLRLQSRGDDPQTAQISLQIGRFSRPVLHFRISPRDDRPAVHVYVCHFKSKRPTGVSREPWFAADRPRFAPHAEALGAALSTVRRTAEAAALRVLLTGVMRGSDAPVVVLGDLNDGLHSNTLNILGGQPRYLTGLSAGGSDVDLYNAQTLQNYRAERDVYYTHEFNRRKESLDQILVSQEFYDHSRRRVWAFDGLLVDNDHLNRDDQKDAGTSDHGIVTASFKYSPSS